MLKPTIKIVLISTVIFATIVFINEINKEIYRIKDFIFITDGNALMLDNIELSEDDKIINTNYYKSNKVVEIMQHRKYEYDYKNYSLELRLGELFRGDQLFLLSSDNINICKNDLSVNFNDQPIEFICKEKRNGYLIKIYYDDNPELKWEDGSRLQFGFFNKNNQQIKIIFIFKYNKITNDVDSGGWRETLIAKVFYWWYGLENPKDTYYFDDY